MPPPLPVPTSTSPAAPGTPTALLHRLVPLRRFEVASQLAVLLAATLGLGMPLPLPVMLSAIGVLPLANLVLRRQLRSLAGRDAAAGEKLVLAQLAVDVAVLAVLLYCAGGSANPFVSMLLVPLTLVAASLSAPYVAAMAALTLGAYSLLMVVYHPLPTPRLDLSALDALFAPAEGSEHVHSGFGLHVVGMWFNFVASATVVGIFVTRLARALREREQALAEAREQALRHEHLIGIATLAAGSAHKLGTPLSTLAVTLHELRRERPDDAELQDELALLEDQVGRCKTILKEIAAAAEPARTPLPVADWLAALADEWQVIRPRARLVCDLSGAGTAPVAPERALENALLNLLDNAADATPEGGEPLRFIGRIDGDRLILSIADRGPGPGALGQRLGAPVASSKRDGLGIGYFLANAAVERLGGQVSLVPRDDGPGTLTRIDLPLIRLGPGPATPDTP